MLKKLVRSKKTLLATGSAVVLTVQAGVANAALDVAVTDAMTATQADIVEAGGLIIVLAVVAMGLRWVKATFF